MSCSKVTLSKSRLKKKLDRCTVIFQDLNKNFIFKDRKYRWIYFHILCMHICVNLILPRQDWFLVYTGNLPTRMSKFTIKSKAQVGMQSKKHPKALRSWNAMCTYSYSISFATESKSIRRGFISFPLGNRFNILSKQHVTKFC